MASIKAYIYNTELDCQTAIDSINTSFGIPVSNDSITRTYCIPIFNNGKYVIYEDSNLIPILGQPQDFEFIEPQTNPF
jgi:hypothetical protein